MGVVAAPPGVQSPNLPFGEGEAGRPDVQDGGGVRAGAALAALPQVSTDDKRPPLRCPLFAPPAGEVEDFLRRLWYRISEDEVIQLVRLRPGVDQPGPTAQQTAGGQLQRQGQGQLGDRVSASTATLAGPALTSGGSPPADPTGVRPSGRRCT